MLTGPLDTGRSTVLVMVPCSLRAGGNAWRVEVRPWHGCSGGQTAPGRPSELGRSQPAGHQGTLDTGGQRAGQRLVSETLSPEAVPQSACPPYSWGLLE